MLVNIKDYPELMKDPNTGAIINRDNLTREKYRTQRQKNEEMLRRLDNLEKDVQSINTKLDDLGELKDMLGKLLEGK